MNYENGLIMQISGTESGNDYGINIEGEDSSVMSNGYKLVESDSDDYLALIKEDYDGNVTTIEKKDSIIKITVKDKNEDEIIEWFTGDYQKVE